MLETARLRLRRLTESDAAGYAELIGDPEVMRFIGAGFPARRERALEEIAALNARHDADGFGVLGIELRADARLVGRAGFHVWDRRDWNPGKTLAELGEHAEIELGWALVRDAWGHGFATEAAAALVAHAFGPLGRTRLVSLIHPANERSLRVAARLGAVCAGEVETARWGPAEVFEHRPR